MTKNYVLLTALGSLFLLVACTAEPDANTNRVPDAAWTNPDCDLNGDDDGDGILNSHEGCMYDTDTDGDGVPDYLDLDSDNDGVSDATEAGDQNMATVPKDYDGDGVPDFRDPDSDNDGVDDGDEDRDGNGLVGNCGITCDMNPDDCGPGQYCLATGVCDPPVTFECAGGETDRLNPDTDGDGTIDSQEGTFICNPQSESNPNGRRPVQFFNAVKFQIGTEFEALITEQLIENRTSEICDDNTDNDSDGNTDCKDEDCHNTSVCGGVSITFDMEDPNGLMAGFAFTRVPKAETVEEENTLIIQELTQTFGTDAVVMRASGSPKLSHDEFPMVVRTMVDLTGLSPRTVNEARNKLVAFLIGKTAAEVENFPEDFGTQDSNFVLAYSLQRRTEGAGDPYIVVMGAVGTSADYNNHSKDTGFHVDDASNGSGLAGDGNPHEAECETYLVATVPIADVIWVIDESGSMYEEQSSVASNAVNFFNRAVAYGLDFRMGVVGVGEINNGELCTGQGQSGDYFLGPGDLTNFQDCVMEPWGSGQEEGGTEHGITQGYNAITTHLPRGDAPNRIRPDAQLVIIYVSDERAQELKDDCGAGEGSGMATIDPACMQSVIGPTVNLLMGISNPEGAGRAHAIVGPPPSGCSTANQVGQGYVEIVNATGGQVGSVCQTDLGSTLQIIIEDIVASSSPVVLHHYPISVSLACAKDGQALERSREDGFDYRASANTIVFIQQDFDPLHPSEVLVSYQRWITDAAPPD